MAALLAHPRIAVAQSSRKVYRIGFLGTTTPRTHGAFLDAFRDGLRDRGYVEGTNVVIEYRWAESNYARLPAMAAELVSQNVDLILTHGTPGGRAAKGSTSTIPVVIAITGDADATGLVESLAHPGGNITGSSFSFPDLNAKRIELLKEALPTVKRVAVLMNDTNAGNLATFDVMTRTARTVRVEIVQILAHAAEGFLGAFDQISRARCDGLSVYEDPLFVDQAARLAALAQRHQLPSIGFKEYADGGGLIGFGVNFPDVWRRAAGFVDRIFRGAKPADLPVERPVKYDFIVNMRTAKVLKVAIRPAILARADAVIE